METINKYKFIVILFIIILFSISVSLGLTFHNENEDKYEIILKIYCNFSKEKMFGKNTAYTSTLIFLVIGGYLGLLFLNYKIKKHHSQRQKFFYNWNKGRKLESLKIALFSFLLPAILFIPIVFIKKYILRFILSSLIYTFFGYFLFGLAFYYACIIFKKKEIRNGNPLLTYSIDDEINEKVIDIKFNK